MDIGAARKFTPNNTRIECRLMNATETNAIEPNPAGPGSALDKQLSVRVAVTWAAAALVAAVSATTWLVNRASESEVAALKTQLASQHGSSADSQEPIAPTVQPQAQSGSAEELSAQIARLEKEKQALVARLGEVSRDALSPTSELGGLLQQLESSDASARSDAAIGLLELRDSRAALPLANYYWRNPDEATGTPGPNRYLNSIFAMDADVGIDFAFRMLQEDKSHRRELAATFLEMLVTTDAKKIEAEKVTSQLQDVALRSKDALVRTRAKLILKRKAEWDKEFPAETKAR
jgi:hypothetical protein